MEDDASKQYTYDGSDDKQKENDADNVQIVEHNTDDQEHISLSEAEEHVGPTPDIGAPPEEEHKDVEVHIKKVYKGDEEVDQYHERHQ